MTVMEWGSAAGPRTSPSRRILPSTCQEVLCALQEPPPLGVVYVPDIESPETDPVYVIPGPPTVPNLIALPTTVP